MAARRRRKCGPRRGCEAFVAQCIGLADLHTRSAPTVYPQDGRGTKLAAANLTVGHRVAKRVAKIEMQRRRRLRPPRLPDRSAT